MLSLENVSHIYKTLNNGRAGPVFQDISFQIRRGELACLIGPSGCGKTTLLNLAAGFLRPESGVLSVNGRPISGPGPDRGVVFQEPTLFPWLTVQKNVEFGLRRLGVNRRQRCELVDKYLGLVGLAELADARPHTLSGGQKQRAALARVMVLKPLLLLMDEPFSALDAPTRERLQDELLSIRNAEGVTILFVTHSLEEAVYLADRILVMNGRPSVIRADLPGQSGTSHVRQSPAHRELAGLVRTFLEDRDVKTQSEDRIT